MFLNGIRFNLRESVNISFLNACVNGRFVQWRWSESVWEKILLCSVTVAKDRFFCDTTFCWNKLTTYEPPYVVTPNCLWSLVCQIVSVLKFLTGASAKLKRGHVKRYAVVLSVLGASWSGLCPGPRVHLIRPWVQQVISVQFCKRWYCVMQ